LFLHTSETLSALICTMQAPALYPEEIIKQSPPVGSGEAA
jgi:hypothetical protein